MFQPALHPPARGQRQTGVNRTDKKEKCRLCPLPGPATLGPSPAGRGLRQLTIEGVARGTRAGSVRGFCGVRNRTSYAAHNVPRILQTEPGLSKAERFAQVHGRSPQKALELHSGGPSKLCDLGGVVMISKLHSVS